MGLDGRDEGGKEEEETNARGSGKGRAEGDVGAGSGMCGWVWVSGWVGVRGRGWVGECK